MKYFQYSVMLIFKNTSQCGTNVTSSNEQLELAKAQSLTLY